MLKRTAVAQNTVLQWAKTITPSNEIRSQEWRANPERLIKYKKLYFTMGLDQQPLRRSALIMAETARLYAAAAGDQNQLQPADPTGFRKARRLQLYTWKMRIQYQEYHLQHLFTRHVWGLLRKYPSGGAKIAGFADKGYFGYDSVGAHRWANHPLPASAEEIYPRRR